MITIEDHPKIGFIVDPREIGGGQMWMRGFVARLECNYIVAGLEESDAHKHAYNVLGKLMANSELAPIGGIVDSFGEVAIQAFVFSNTMFESGGPPASFIFRGKVLFQVLTERP